MEDKITKNAIEKFAIELLEKQGYQYIYAPSIAPDCAVKSPLVEPQKRAHSPQLAAGSFKYAVRKIVFLLILGPQL